ncbi:hypothetical protein ABEV38_19295 [Parageobacillus thermoglucosidasius]|uniref:hypothetical protein n=1 Tax=Parageobacillus thermoglucosidasius TaxID=1426 RepID=UPI003D2786CF
MDLNDKLRINLEIQRIIDKQILIAQEQLKLSRELEKDPNNQELLNQIKKLSDEKNQLYAKSKELEKKLFE